MFANRVECIDRADVLLVVDQCRAAGFLVNVDGLTVTYWR